jgi:chemotaxis protein MotB
MPAPSNIIIKKVKKGGHGHHGGAWKVAYADFVTAMMAFFLLMWLLASTPQEKLEGIADFFTPTVGLKEQKGIGKEGGISPKTKGTKKSDATDSALVFSTTASGAIVKNPDNRTQAEEENEAQNFSKTEHDLYKAIEKNPDLKEFKDSILIEQTPEGLKIQLLDQQKKPMFQPGTSIMQPYAENILKKIARIIHFLPNYISIAGHTNSERFSRRKTGDNWQLSSDRANTTRRLFVDNKLIDHEQIARIVGKAEQEPLDIQHPEEARNMRIEILLLRNSILPFQKRSAPDEAAVPVKDKTLEKEPETVPAPAKKPPAKAH